MINSIRAIQTQLQAEGYYKQSLNGIFCAKSQEALRRCINDKRYEIYFDFIMFKKVFERKTIDQSFVDSINNLFKAFNKFNDIDGTNPLNVAYMLATAWHETGYKMTAIREAGGYKYLSKYDTGRLAYNLGNTPQADGDGQKYAGRGHVMITGKSNYAKFSKLLNMDLINNPDLALDPVISANILTIGCLKGSFTSRKLSDYIKLGNRSEFISARKVVNGTDKNSDIATYAEKFLQCLVLKKL
ncbi:glycoside hydrolase family 19 protein [Psychrobacter sp. ASPA161_9]|uniref:glycoside hydrolase family 19 protein n=1 Tax=Psychrobacter sp. ASPA161_9 TaxID=3160961 RepID=UPI003F811E46